MNAKLTMEAKLRQALVEHKIIIDQKDAEIARLKGLLLAEQDRIKRDIARLERKTDEIIDSFTDEQREELNVLSKRGVQ